MEYEFSHLVDMIPGLVWTALPDGHIDFLNQRWCEYTGLGVAEARGQGWQTAIHPEDLREYLERWRSILASREPGEMEARLRRFDGEYHRFLFRTCPTTDASGQVIKWCGIITDIDCALKRSEAFLAEAQRLSSTGSFSWRHETEQATWSEQLYRIFEFEQGVPVTRELIASRVHPDDLSQWHENFDRAQRDRGDFEHAYRLQMPDHSIKYLHVVCHRSRDQDGRLQYIGAIQDVTERQRAEEALAKVRSELAHVSRVTSLGALTASIAHEVSQPLSGIITNANTCLRMLSADPPNVDGARETARRTIRDGSRASDVITRLRALFSKKHVINEPVDLNEVTRELITVLRYELQTREVILREELADDLPPVAGDRVLLQQVILNLLRNAVDAMDGVDDRPRRLVIKSERDEDDRVRLTVQDTGMGFERQGVGRLFDPFYTTKNGGMGIGLSVSRSIIESHRGRLWARPNDGPGATFSFSIPRASKVVTDTQSLDAIRTPVSGAGHAMRNS
jgi:PAS domain S-box-containing protein